MQNPLKLEVGKLAEDLAVLVYDLTRQFPDDERFGLSSQLRRASVSIGSNIFEGAGAQTDSGFVVFLHYCVRSSNEVEFQVRVASRLGYLSPDEAARIRTQNDIVRKKVIRLIASLRSARNA